MVIVAAVDQSERSSIVIEEAGKLAEAFDEPVHVVHVLTTSAFIDMGRTKAKEGDSVDMGSVRKVATEIADENASHLDRPYEAVGLMGNPAEKVVEYANENDARYIVTAGRKRSPAGKAIFGSVAQSIIIESACPVVMSSV